VSRKFESRGVAFVGINVQWDKEPDALRFVETYRLPYVLARDAGGAVGKTYGVDGTPTTYVIDRAGRVSASHVGSLDFGQLSRLLEAALGRA
jgi:cytochrome c biogenesis protein CcmG/thiol:disulfide interchange protein DsbE